jgi:hypothetical protein
MKLLQLRNRKESLILSAELASYGLCPGDWILKEQKNNIYRIENRTEPEFCFLGRTKTTDGQIKWQTITLKSV